MTRPTVLVLGAAGRFGPPPCRPLPPPAGACWRSSAATRAAGRPASEWIDTRWATPPRWLPEPQAARGGARRQPDLHTLGRRVAAAVPPGPGAGRALGARFMLPGNVYNYGSGHARAAERRHVAAARHRKGRTARGHGRRDAAQRAAAGLDSVVIRAGDFFGGGSGTWLDQAMVKDIGKGKLVYPGPLDRVHAWAYLPDLARAFVAVAGDGGHRGCLRAALRGPRGDRAMSSWPRWTKPRRQPGPARRPGASRSAACPGA
jgi:hypothetical protein